MYSPSPALPGLHSVQTLVTCPLTLLQLLQPTLEYPKLDNNFVSITFDILLSSWCLSIHTLPIQLKPTRSNCSAYLTTHPNVHHDNHECLTSVSAFTNILAYSLTMFCTNTACMCPGRAVTFGLSRASKHVLASDKYLQYNNNCDVIKDQCLVPFNE